MSSNETLTECKNYVTTLLKSSIPETLLFHNLKHTESVVKDAIELGAGVGLSESDMEILLLAAWFHDTGYTVKYEGHEKESERIAAEFLKERNYPADGLNKVVNCIRATQLPQEPKDTLSKLLCDADLFGIAKKSFLKYGQLLRVEWGNNYKKAYTEEEWLKVELEFLHSHKYFTNYAKEKYSDQKRKNINKLKKKLEKLTKPNTQIMSKLEKKETKKEQQSEGSKRGIETMFRVTSTNHIRLSAIADNKANIMLSINAIIISITVSSLLPGFGANPDLIVPSAILVLVCVLSMIFATLSTMPKVTSGKFTQDDIKQKRANLLFFGNFHKMKLEDFEWGMTEMMNDRSFLYGSMIKDLYYLGLVLAKKYKYLRVCYTVFMLGIIISVISFAITFIIKE